MGRKRQVLFPIRLDDTILYTQRKWAAQTRFLLHIGDFTGWKDHDRYQRAFKQLLHDLAIEPASENRHE
jgi:hypothetical protein